MCEMASTSYIQYYKKLLTEMVIHIQGWIQDFPTGGGELSLLWAGQVKHDLSTGIWGHFPKIFEKLVY